MLNLGGVCNLGELFRVGLAAVLNAGREQEALADKVRDDICRANRSVGE